MKVIGILFGLGVLLALIAVLFVAGAVVLGLLYLFWPFFVGLASGVFLWYSGSDNAGVIVFLAFLGVQWWWSEKQPKGGRSSYNPMSGKGKIYDSKGRTTGYYDKH